MIKSELFPDMICYSGNKMADSSFMVYIILWNA